MTGSHLHALPPDRNHSGRNLRDTALRRQQIELRRGIPSIHDLDPETQRVNLSSRLGGKRKHGSARTQDQQICKTTY